MEVNLDLELIILIFLLFHVKYSLLTVFFFFYRYQITEAQRTAVRLLTILTPRAILVTTVWVPLHTWALYNTAPTRGWPMWTLLPVTSTFRQHCKCILDNPHMCRIIRTSQVQGAASASCNNSRMGWTWHQLRHNMTWRINFTPPAPHSKFLPPTPSSMDIRVQVTLQLPLTYPMQVSWTKLTPHMNSRRCILMVILTVIWWTWEDDPGTLIGPQAAGLDTITSHEPATCLVVKGCLCTTIQQLSVLRPQE